MELDLDKNVGQVLSQLCGLLADITDIYQYRGAKVNQMRRRIVSLLEFGLHKTIHAAKIGRPPLSSRRNYYRTSERFVLIWTDIANFAMDLVWKGKRVQSGALKSIFGYFK